MPRRSRPGSTFSSAWYSPAPCGLTARRPGRKPPRGRSVPRGTEKRREDTAIRARSPFPNISEEPLKSRQGGVQILPGPPARRRKARPPRPHSPVLCGERSHGHRRAAGRPNSRGCPAVDQPTVHAGSRSIAAGFLAAHPFPDRVMPALRKHDSPRSTPPNPHAEAARADWQKPRRQAGGQAPSDPRDASPRCWTGGSQAADRIKAICHEPLQQLEGVRIDRRDGTSARNPEREAHGGRTRVRDGQPLADSG